MSTEDSELLEEFYDFLRESKTGTLATFCRKKEIAELHERKPTAIDLNLVDSLITAKLHRLYELLMDRLEDGEKLNFPPKVLEVLLNQLQDRTFGLDGALKLNIEVDLSDSSRLLFEQEKISKNAP